MLHFSSTAALSIEVLPVAALGSLRSEWERLSREALEDNVYYAPVYANALLGSVDAKRNIMVVTGWHGGRLVAFLPVERARTPLPGVRPGGRAWQTRYTFSCTPLLHRDLPAGAAELLLDGLTRLCRGEWLLPRLNIDGPSCKALLATMEQRAVPWAFSEIIERAQLNAGPSFEEHLRLHIRPKRRNELRRIRRRLEEMGEVRHEVQRSGEGLSRAVDAFLDIEAAGWKGRQGTALACNPHSKAFALAAFTGDEETSICRADVLLLNAAPVAVGLTVFAGQTGFTVKNAYDERFRSFGVGLLLEMEVLSSFLDTGWADRLDSGTDGSHVIDDLWPQRIPVGHLGFSLASHGAEQRLALLARTQRLEIAMRALARRMHQAVRRHQVFPA